MKKKKERALGYFTKFNADPEKSMETFNHNMGADTASVGEAIESRGNEMITNNKIREALKKIELEALDTTGEYHDLVNLFEANKDRLDYDDKKAIMDATRHGKLSDVTNVVNQVTIESDPKLKRQQEKELAAAPQASVQQESYDVDDLNQIFNEELMNEGRNDLEPKKCVSIETHTTYWSPWDTKKKDFAKFGIRYRYEDRNACLDAINDPDNDLGYALNKKDDVNNDNSDIDDEESMPLAASYESESDNENNEVLQESEDKNDVVIDESVRLHIDGDDDDNDKEYSNVRIARKHGEASGKDWEIYQYNEMSGEKIHIDSSSDTDEEEEDTINTDNREQDVEIKLSTPKTVELTPEQEIQLTGITLAADNGEHITEDQYNQAIISKGRKPSNSNPKGTPSQPFEDIWLLIVVYMHTYMEYKDLPLPEIEKIGYSKVQIQEWMQLADAKSRINGGTWNNLKTDRPQLIRVGYFADDGSFVETQEHETEKQHGGKKFLVYPGPMGVLKAFIENTQPCMKVDSKTKKVIGQMEWIPFDSVKMDYKKDAKGHNLPKQPMEVNLLHDIIENKEFMAEYGPEYRPARVSRTVANGTMNGIVGNSEEIKKGKEIAKETGKVRRPGKEMTIAGFNAPTQQSQPVQQNQSPDNASQDDDVSSEMQDVTFDFDDDDFDNLDPIEEDFEPDESEIQQNIHPIESEFDKRRKEEEKAIYKAALHIPDDRDVTPEDYDDYKFDWICMLHNWVPEMAYKDIWGEEK